MARPRNDAQDGDAPSAQVKVKMVKCITTRRPWAQPVGEDEPRPLKLGDVVSVDLGQAKNLVDSGFVSLWDADMED